MQSAGSDLGNKQEALGAILRECESVIVSYSGGVDSAYLASAALDTLGSDRVLAVTGISPAYPKHQRTVAHQVAAELQLPHIEVDTGELSDPDYRANGTDRCFFCKTELFSVLSRLAERRGFKAVVDGSNADDATDHRPGAVAARELRVRSPLQEADLTKEEIRELSRRRGLPTWELPASPCLASRIAYGIEVTPKRLRAIEAAEENLRLVAPWGALRVRHHGDWVRVEVDPRDVERFADPELFERTRSALLSAGLTRACLDLLGYRRGALNKINAATEPEPGAGSISELSALATARFRSVGRSNEVAVIGPGEAGNETVLRDRQRISAAGRRLGFRFVALELIG